MAESLSSSQAMPSAATSPFSWKAIAGIALQHRKALLVANLVAIMGALASIPVPLLLPLLVDEVLLQQSGPIVPVLDSLLPGSWQTAVGYILAVFVVTVLLRLVSLGFMVAQVRQFTGIAKDVVFRLRRQLLSHLGRVSMAEFETLGSGGVASRFVSDMDTIDDFVGTTVSRLVVAILSLVGAAGVLLWMHWQLALFILFLNPFVVYGTTLMGKKVKALKKRENQSYEVFQQALTETLDAIQQIRASNRERHYLLRLVDRAAELRDFSGNYEWRSNAANRLSFLVFLLGLDVFRAVAMVTVLLSDLSVGQMFAVFGYLWFMMTPVQEILTMQYSYFAANAALARLNGLMQLDTEPEYPQQENPFKETLTVGIEVDDLHFAYADEEVLRGVSLHVEPGEKVALVGASGGGKSTLVQALIGLYTPQCGRLAFGGVPIERIGLPVVREHVAIVLQHPALLNDTVRANLTLGLDMDDGALWQALEIAQLKATVAGLSQGLDTVVGRQGVRLSGGQRQRLAIARMILSDPSVVILDEATSALDAETEYRLHAALATFLAGRTTLIVAHRLSAVKQADRVFVFENGEIAEQGQHHELVAQQGLYAQLYAKRQ